MCHRTIRREDPDWVYRGFLRALTGVQLAALAAWQLERKEIGDPERVADAALRLELLDQELIRRDRRLAKRNGRQHSAAEALGIDYLRRRTGPGASGQ